MSEFYDGVVNTIGNISDSIADIYKTKYITEKMIPQSSIAYQSTINSTLPLMMILGVFLLLFYKRIKI